MLIINANAKVRADTDGTGTALVIVRHLILMKHGKNKSLVVPFMTAGQIGKARQGRAGQGAGSRQPTPRQAMAVLLSVFVCEDEYPYSRWRKKGFISKWQ